jgi:hypothetical protein
MADPNIHAHLITKPFQLLAAWLIGLILTDGALLTGARLISTPTWVPGLLSIAAVLCVPLFLVSIFLLQTKFRPEMQEDTFYSPYLQQQRQQMADQKKGNAGVEAEVRELKSKLIEIDSESSEQGSEITENTARVTEREELVRRISQLETQLEQVRDVQPEVGATDTSLSSVGRFREINLVDSNNKTRALFTTLIDDEPSLMFFGKEGYEPGQEASHTILLDSTNDGDVSLRMRSGRLGGTAEVYLDDRMASFSIHDAGRQASIGMNIQNGEANLSIGSKQYQTHIILRARADGSTWVTVIRDGRTIWSAAE